MYSPNVAILQLYFTFESSCNHHQALRRLPSNLHLLHAPEGILRVFPSSPTISDDFSSYKLAFLSGDVQQISAENPCFKAPKTSHLAPQGGQAFLCCLALRCTRLMGLSEGETEVAVVHDD